METYVLHFLWLACLLLLCFVAAIHLMRNGVPEQAGDGLFVLHRWSQATRGFIALAVIVTLVVPLVLYLSGVIFGGLLAAFEGWDFVDGFYYVTSNMLGLPGSLTTVSPTMTSTKIFDLIVSLWALLLSSSVLGVTGSMNAVTQICETMPSSALGLARYLLVYVPILLILLSAACGGILAAVEGWSFADGFVFMAGSLCGIETPLTTVVPTTHGGFFVTSLCFLLELTIGGAVIGIIGSHPFCSEILEFFEGKRGSEAGDSKVYTDPVVATVAGDSKEEDGGQLVPLQQLEHERQDKQRIQRELDSLLRERAAQEAEQKRELRIEIERAAQEVVHEKRAAQEVVETQLEQERQENRELRKEIERMNAQIQRLSGMALPGGIEEDEV